MIFFFTFFRRNNDPRKYCRYVFLRDFFFPPNLRKKKKHGTFTRAKSRKWKCINYNCYSVVVYTFTAKHLLHVITRVIMQQPKIFTGLFALPPLPVYAYKLLDNLHRNTTALNSGFPLVDPIFAPSHRFHSEKYVHYVLCAQKTYYCT